MKYLEKKHKTISTSIWYETLALRKYFYLMTPALVHLALGFICAILKLSVRYKNEHRNYCASPLPSAPTPRLASVATCQKQGKNSIAFTDGVSSKAAPVL
jgi:hypothetical protein